MMSISNNPHNIFAQIEDLRQLKDGWLNGEGLAPSKQGLDWIAKTLDRYFTDKTAPYIYPTPDGGVQAEWSIGHLEISLNINIKAHSAYWHSLDLNNSNVLEKHLNLNNQNDWEWIKSFILSRLNNH
jgi:hypothetical protein